MNHKAYIKHSDGKKAVVFIHGFLGSPNHFDRFVQLLPDSIGVYNILLVGHGKSVRDFSNASMTKWKKQVSDILDELSFKYDEIIIVAHSMGTFFAMEEAIKREKIIKAILFLAVPLKICVKPRAFYYTLKSFFNISLPKDKVALAYKNAHSIKLTKKVWQYIGWIPRYLELFAESKKSRERVLKINVPCVAIQSAKDELVSFKSVKFLKENNAIKTIILKNSTHFIYNDNDEQVILDAFEKILNN